LSAPQAKAPRSPSRRRAREGLIGIARPPPRVASELKTSRAKWPRPATFSSGQGRYEPELVSTGSNGRRQQIGKRTTEDGTGNAIFDEVVSRELKESSTSRWSSIGTRASIE
jgi:hypothetical protein